MKVFKKSKAYGAFEYTVIIGLIIVLAILIFLMVKNRAKTLTWITSAQDKVMNFIGGSNPGIPSEPDPKLELTFYEFDENMMCMGRSSSGEVEIISPHIEAECFGFEEPYNPIYRDTIYDISSNHFLFEAVKSFKSNAMLPEEMITISENKLKYDKNLLSMPMPIPNPVEEITYVINIYQFSGLTKVEKNGKELYSGFPVNSVGLPYLEDFDYEIKTAYNYLEPVNCEVEGNPSCYTDIEVSTQLVDKEGDKSKVYRFIVSVNDKIIKEEVKELDPSICPISKPVMVNEGILDDGFKIVEEGIIGKNKKLYDYNLFSKLDIFNSFRIPILDNDLIEDFQTYYDYYSIEKFFTYVKIDGKYYKYFRDPNSGEDKKEEFLINENSVYESECGYDRIFAVSNNKVFIKKEGESDFSEIPGLSNISNIESSISFNLFISNDNKVYFSKYGDDKIINEINVGDFDSYFFNKENNRLYLIKNEEFKVYDLYEKSMENIHIPGGGVLKLVDSKRGPLIILGKDRNLYALNDMNETTFFELLTSINSGVKDIIKSNEETYFIDSDFKLNKMGRPGVYDDVNNDSRFSFMPEKLECTANKFVLFIERVSFENQSNGIVLEVSEGEEKHYRFLETALPKPE